MKQQGIALLQVLLLSTILMVLLLAANHQARQHIKLASAVQHYTQANLALHSTEAEILFTMLSTLPLQLQQKDNSTGARWNFHGELFQFGEVDVRIQDTSGLLSAASPNPAMLKAFTERQSGSETLGRQIAAALADWQDKDDIPRLDGAEQADYPNYAVRNAPIQYLEEWLFIKGVSPDLFAKIQPLLTMFPQGVNINQQPEALWRLYLSETQVAELTRARANGELTESLFQAISGITIDEFTRFATGPAYRISFTVKNGDVRLSRELTLRLMPFQMQPLDIYEYRLRNLPTDVVNAAHF